MATRKRTQANTVAGKLELIEATSTKLQPKLPLSDRALTIFNFITSARETGSWNDNDLYLASHLAHQSDRLEKLNFQYDNNNWDRDDKANPLIGSISTVTATIQQLQKTLGLSASQRGLSGAPQGARNKADEAAREAIFRAAQFDLL